MKVLLITPEAYIILNGHSYNGGIIEAVLDGNGNWIVGLEVRDSGDFPLVQDTLNSLEEIDWVKPIVDEDV